MTVVNIKFKGAYTPPDNDLVNLNFGELVTPVDIPDTVISFILTVPSIQLSASVVYASNLGVNVAGDFGGDWQAAARTDNTKGVAWDYAGINRTENNSSWADGLDSAKILKDGYQDTRPLKVGESLHWQIAAQSKSQSKLIAHKVLKPWKLNKDFAWAIANKNSKITRDKFKQLTPLPVFKVVPWVLTLKSDSAFGLLYSKLAKKLRDQRFIPWQQGRHPPSGMESDGVIVQPPVDPYVASTDLNFVCVCNYVDHLRVYINFGVDPCPGRGIIVPSRRVYVIMNDITLIRVSDSTEIGVYSVSVGTDMSSWCWSFTATIVADDLDLVEPSSGPVEVELTINGISWRFIVEEYSESKSFGRRGVDISGRSLTALLENPYAPVRNYSQLTTLTSRQLADNELNRPNVAPGFNLAWTLVDELGWSMPLNSWSYDNLTPIQAIQAIAQGSGGFVNSHRVGKELIVAPEYPWASWEIGSATLNKSIPKSLIKLQNIRWQEKPLYNGVYVTGQNTGVTALVKRTGTDGAFQAPIFMSPMITTPAVARNKGISILSAGGMQADVNLSFPFHPDIGVLTPGMVIEITNGGFGSDPAWRAFVRGTTIQATRQQGGLTVEQQVQLERHYGGL